MDDMMSQAMKMQRKKLLRLETQRDTYLERDPSLHKDELLAGIEEEIRFRREVVKETQ